MIFTNLVAGMVLLSQINRIPTNTPAFQEYAFRECFKQAASVASNMNLDLPHPITTNMVTHFEAYPNPSGAWASIIFNNRFCFGWDNGCYSGFSDRPYLSQAFSTDNVETNDAIKEKLMYMTNHLTLKKARQMAEQAIRKAGLHISYKDLKNPDEAGQFKYEWKDGKTYPLPYYRFAWRTDKGFYYSVDISGITSNVVYFGYGWNDLQLPRPTNYYEMLGLTNKPVFVKRMFTAPGQSPTYRTYPP
jgi:hypothetical protein